MRWCFAALLFFCFAAHAEKNLVFCSEASPSTLNPQLAADSATFNASSHMLFDRLLEFEPGTTNVVPGLAESWDISKTGRVYTFHLRHDVWFHTTAVFKPTRPMNADDVLFSFNRMRLKTHPFFKVGGGKYEYFQSMGLNDLIDDILKIDDYTVRFVLVRPEAPFLSDLALSFAVILSKEYGQQLLKNKTPGKLDAEPVGTGPFILKRYVKDNSLRYEANRKYFRGSPKLDKVTFLITPDPSVRLQKLKNGECHLIADPSPSDLKTLKSSANLQLASTMGDNLGFISLNVRKKPFDNLKVREAIAHALNIPSYVNAVFSNMASVAKTAVPSTVWGSNDHIPAYDYNVEKAKRLLKEAGYPDGFDTELWTLPVVRQYNPNGKKMGELIQADLAKIGVRVKLVSYDWPTYLEKLRHGEHAMAENGWISDNGDPDNFLNMTLSCQSVRGGTNSSQWCNSAFDQVLNSAKMSSDTSVRTKAYLRAQEIIHAQVPMIPISVAKVFRGLSKKVVGYKISPIGIEDFYGVDLQ